MPPHDDTSTPGHRGGPARTGSNRPLLLIGVLVLFVVVLGILALIGEWQL